MDVRYTRHALQRMRDRGVDRAWVEGILRSPDWVEPEPGDPEVSRYFGVRPEFGGKVLRVAAKQDRGAFVVVTAMFDRKARVRRSGS